MCRNRRAHSAGLTSQNWHSLGLGRRLTSPTSSPAPGLSVCSPSIVDVVANDVGSLLSYSTTLKKQMNYNVKPFSGKWSESPSSPLRAGKGILFGERPALDQPAVGISQRVGNEKLWRKLEQCKEFSTTTESGIYQTGIKHLIVACFWPLDEFWTMAGGWPNRGKGQIPCLSGPRGGSSLRSRQWLQKIGGHASSLGTPLSSTQASVLSRLFTQWHWQERDYCNQCTHQYQNEES